MGTSSAVRPLALAILLALLLHGDADAASTRGLEERFENPYAGVLRFNTFWARHVAGDNPWHNRSGANETDPVSAVIAKRMAAVGSTYGFVRLWLSGRCQRTGNDGAISGITRRCYLRELRRLEEELRPRRPPPPPPESPDGKARREVLQILMQSTVTVYPWPEIIRNPVIKTRLRPYRAPRSLPEIPM
ncbi:unnamed protein product [Miscanthus lutarioriparius]|uniref:Uncharacterized protein n=1 Tax=Miscanthus lutarioriparius TaxID=422564 RepID=A0A811NKL9_9POAL|nr:unnamed protein product [Miscanthus lutarioriparius]